MSSDIYDNILPIEDESGCFQIAFTYITKTGNKGSISYNVCASDRVEARKKASVLFLNNYKELREQ